MTIREWILSGVATAFVAISAYLANQLITRNNSALDALGTKVEKLQSAITTNRVNGSTLSQANTDLRNDITDIKRQGNETDKRVRWVQIEIARIEGTLKMLPAKSSDLPGPNMPTQ